MPLNKTFIVRTSPHISASLSVDIIMRNVVLALLPSVGFAVYLYGLAALIILTTACLSCVVTEHLLCRINQQETSIGDWSAVITGLIYGLTLPPGLPLWMVVIGGFIAIAMAKYLFGGLGCNPFNPALVARAFLQAAFPIAMTTWSPILAADRFTHIPASLMAFPFSKAVYDVTSGATPLAAFKFDGHSTDAYDLILGLSSGSLGESCSLSLLAGGLYLIARNMMNWRIPAGIFASVLLIGLLFHSLSPALYPSPWFSLFAGGLMLGALFMATDPVASPLTAAGCFVYGVIIGVLVMVIRYWAGMAEGMMYAILIANALSPHIDRLVKPRVYGVDKHHRQIEPGKT